MPIVIFAIVVMAIFAASAFRTASDARRAAWSTRSGGLALYVAEGGMRKTLGNWPSSVAAMNPGDSLDLGWQSLPNRATYRAVIHRVDNGGLQMYRVIVRGRTLAGVSGQSTVTETVGGVPLFRFGVFTESYVKLSGSALDDSYDSDLGPYNVATSGQAGDIATNGNVTLGLGTTVEGNVSAKGSILSYGTVTGTTSQNPAGFPQMPSTTCPAGGYTPVPLAGYNPSNGNLNVGGSTVLTLTAPPNQYHFKSINVSGTATLVVNTGGQHVDIIVDDAVTFSGSVQNVGATPTELEFQGCGTTTSNWNISGSALGQYVVYAPTHPVVISGTGQLFGAIVGKSLDLSGGAKIHYDQATARQASSAVMTVAGTWAQYLR
jgi:hypothetical protein